MPDRVHCAHILVKTEQEAKTVDELRAFLKEAKHPVVERWKEEAETVSREVPAEVSEEAQLIPVATAPTLPITAGGFKIILKDAKIYAKKVIIRSEKSQKTEKR